QGIRGGDDDRPVVDFQWQYFVSPRKMNRPLLYALVIDLSHIQMRHTRHLELNGQRLEEQILFNGSDLEQGFTETAAFGLLDVQGFQQLGFREPEFLFEDGPEQKSDHRCVLGQSIHFPNSRVCPTSSVRLKIT